MLTNYQKYRCLEIIPGALVWLTLLGSIILAFVSPVTVVYFIIIFDFYWMVKVLYLSTFLVLSYVQYRRVMSIDWLKRCRQLPLYEQIYHVIMIPNASESITVVESTIQSLLRSTYPTNRIIIAFAAEERFPDSIHNGNLMKERYGHHFYAFEVSTHPADIAGEIAGKGANLAWAGQNLKDRVIDPAHLQYENIIVSVFDVDTCIEPHYFSYLTTVYCAQPEPTKASYQPIPMFHNNIWDAPAIMRVAATGTTFWLMSEQVRPERLFTFSSHSMPWQAMVDVGWWERDVVSDDSRIFLQCFLHYRGNYRVVPLHMPVYMDTVLSDNWWKSLKNLYRQQRRWAFGSENIPYMIWFFWRASSIPLKKRLYHLFNQIEGMWSWGTTPVLIFILGYLPLRILEAQANTSVIAANAPIILQILLTVADVGLVLAVILGTIILPRRPHHYKPSKYIMMLLQWTLLPVSMIIFGTFPAIEAQTRLMLGKYLGFYITEKARKSS